VFSDELETARKIIDFPCGLPVRFVESLSESTSANFDALRLGRGYVIANSSFSWWAARLSRNQPCLVIAPKPWFVGVRDDKTLLPSTWLRFDGHA
jgi:hypothetical protein